MPCPYLAPRNNDFFALSVVFCPAGRKNDRQKKSRLKTI